MHLLRVRATALLLAALLVLGGAACAQETPEGDAGADTGTSEDGTDTGEGAPPEGGLGEDLEEGDS